MSPSRKFLLRTLPQGTSSSRAEGPYMSDYHPASDQHSGKVYTGAAAGAEYAEVWDSTPVPTPVPPTVAADQGGAAVSYAPTPAITDAPYVPIASDQSPPKLYAHKNEILYAF